MADQRILSITGVAVTWQIEESETTQYNTIVTYRGARNIGVPSSAVERRERERI
jgi:hypothetical protein